MTRLPRLRQGWALCGVILFGGMLLWTYDRLTSFLPTAMTGIMLDGARQLYAGKGFVTMVPTVGFLTAYKSLKPPFPYLWYPLVPFVTSWLFHLFGVKPWVLVIVPVASYLGAAVALFFLGRKFFGLTTAIASTVFLLAQPILIEVTLRNPFSDPVLLFPFISCVLCIFIAGDSKRSTVSWLMLAGVLFGIAQYARSAGTMLYLPLIFLVGSMFSKHRLWRIAAFLTPCLAVQLPLFAFTLKATGSLIFLPTYLLLYLTPMFPGYSASRMLLPASPLKIFRLYGSQILHKWISQVWVHYKYLFTMTHPLVLAGAILTLGAKLNRQQEILRNFTCVLYLCLVVQNSLVVWDDRYLMPVVPFVSLLGFEVIQRTIGGLPVRRPMRTVALTALVLLLSTDTVDLYYQAVKHRGRQRAQREAELELAQFIKENVTPGSTVMTPDVGLAVWETGSVSVGIPLDLETAANIYRNYVHFDTIVLYPLGNTELYHFSPEWPELLEGRTTFLGFSREKSVTLVSGEKVVLLRDQTRENLQTDVRQDRIRKQSMEQRL